jgi:hypothetical protein
MITGETMTGERYKGISPIFILEVGLNKKTITTLV